MPKRPDTYYRPETLPEALRLLSQPNAKPLAGGANLLTDDVIGDVVDLQALGLSTLQKNSDHVRVGATITLAGLAGWLMENPTPVDVTTLLQKALQQAGPNTYRHAATVGGVIASRLPDSELLAALLALEAALELQTPEPTTISLADYLLPEERPFGLITHIVIPWVNGRFASERVARTPADYPIVSITAWQPDSGALRLAATGIGPRPVRLNKAEAALAHGELETAVQAAQSACQHAGDFRGDAAYRAEMTTVLTRRVLTSLR